ncbi:MAG: ABC transporter permease [bacterium]
MEKVKGIFAVIKREIKIITSDVNIKSVLLFAPLFYAFFYSTVYINKVEDKLPIAIVDYDNTSTSQKLSTDLNAHQMIDVIEHLPSYEEAKEQLERNKIQGFIVISKGFESDLKQIKGTKIKVYLNTSRFLVSNDINKAVNEVIGAKAVEYRKNYYRSQGYSYEQSKQLSEPIQLDMRPLYNTTESYGDFMLPGLLALILHQTLLIGLAESIAKEREYNLLHQLYAVANNNAFAALIGKISFYFVLFCAYAAFFYIVNFDLFSLTLVGSTWLLIFITLLYLLAIIFMAVFIASFFKRKILSLQVFAFTSIPFFLISGYSFPSSAFLNPINIIANLLPSTPYLHAQIRLTQMGANFNQILTEIIQLVIFVVVGFFASYFRMYKLFVPHNKKLQTIK